MKAILDANTETLDDDPDQSQSGRAILKLTAPLNVWAAVQAAVLRSRVYPEDLEEIRHEAALAWLSVDYDDKEVLSSSDLAFSLHRH